MTAPWWVINMDGNATYDPDEYLFSAWLGIFLMGAAGIAAWTAWRVAEKRAGGRSAKRVGDHAWAAILTAMFWPLALVCGVAVLTWEGLVRLFTVPQRARVAKAKAAKARTPEALRRRARAVRADIERELARLGDDPDRAVERAALEAALSDLKAAP